MRALLGLALALTAPAASANSLRVSGNRLLDGKGRAVALHGVNRSGTEYACIQGWGIFDGPSDAASVRAMAAWQVNFVRVLLNEDCWLGINGVKPGLGGAAYRRAIVRYVGLLHRFGMHVEVSLIWAAPDGSRATYQPGGPDADHSPAMWASMARTFKPDPDVILAPWGETVVDARCFEHGGVCQATYGAGNRPYRTAGMQQAVHVIRAAGYRGVISIPGIDYANDLSHWLSHEPSDPRHQLVAEAHVYGKNSCGTVACLNRTMAPVARRVPLILGEVGETYDGSDCGSGHIAQFLPWADSHQVGYAAWTWDTWNSCDALIKRYDGTPASGYGAWVKAHYGGFAARDRAVAAGAGSRVSACHRANTPASQASVQTMRSAILCLVNQERRRFHLPVLHENAKLDRSAQGHSDDMVRRDYFAHDSPGGENPFQRIAATGYRGSYEGENIATGYPTPASVMRAWMSDVGHCQNILRPQFHDLGIGVDPRGIRAVGSGSATWTQDFGLRNGVRPPSTNSGPAHGCPRGL